MNKPILLTVALAVAAITGCASTMSSLQHETAHSIGGNISPDAVQVKNVSRGIISVKWDATTPQGAYSCSADDRMRRVHCVKSSLPMAQ